MAKIRFPGKALKLNTRKRVRYRGHFTASTPEEIYTRRIRQGLELFYKIFGESDEDEDEFEGFFTSEILEKHVKLSKSITKRQRTLDQDVESTVDGSQSNTGSIATNESNTQSTKLLRGKRKSVNDEKQQHLETRLKDVHKSSSDDTFHKAFDNVEDETIKKYQEQQTTISENKKDIPSEETLLYKRAPRGKEIDGSSGLKTKKSKKQNVGRPPTVKTALAKKLLAKAKKKVPSVPVQVEKSPKKFILPSMSVRSSRIITPNKRLFADITEMCSTSTPLEEPSTSSSMETLSNKRSVKLTQKGRGSHTTFLSRPRSLSQPEIVPSMKIEEKDQLQETISLYTESITCQGKGQVGRPSKRLPHRRDLLLPDDYNDMDDSPVVDKESKVKEKIEKLLRSPWDDRIKQAHGKTSREYEEIQASAGSSMNQGSSISKGIIRKARLNLNKRTLQKIRNPVSLQRLIPTSDEGVVDGKCAFCDISEGDLSRKFGVICCNICSNFISSNSQGATDILNCSKSQLIEPKVSPEKSSESKLSPKKLSSCIIIGTASEDRCSACWLACILNKCAMPNLLHDRLRKRLPQHLKENIPTSLARSVSKSSSSGSLEKQTGDQTLTMGSLQARPLTDSGSHVVFGSLVDLPGGWRRKTQHSQVMVISPCGEKFRTIPKLEQFLKKRGINIEARFLFGNAVSPTVNPEHSSSSNITSQHLRTDKNDFDEKNKVVMTTLPGGWIRRIKWRLCGDKFDTYVYSPDGRTFRSKRELSNYFVQIGKVDDIHKYFPVTTGNSSSNLSSSEQTESSGTEPVQGSSSELQSSSELGSEISSDEKVEGVTDNESDSTAISDKSLTPSGYKLSPCKQTKEERKRALRMLKLPNEDLSIDIDKVEDVKYHDYPKNEIKNKRRYRSLPSSRKLCDEPGMTDTTESESEKMRTSTPLKAFRIKNRNKSKFDSIHNNIESTTKKSNLENLTDNMKDITPGETEEIYEDESIRSTTVQTKNHGKIVLKIKRQSLNKNKANVQGQVFLQERNHPSNINSFELDDSVNDSSQENSDNKIDTGNLKSELMISGELVCNSSREKITTSDTGSYDGLEKDKKNDSSAEEENEMGSTNLDIEDESLSNFVSADEEPFNISSEVEESTLNDGFEMMQQNINDESTLLSHQTVAPNLLKNEPVSPKLKPVSPKLKPVSPKLKPVSPKLKPVSPKLKPVSPKLKPVSPKFKEPKSIKDTASSDDSKVSSPVLSESDNVRESKQKVKLKSGKTRRSSDFLTQRFGNGWSRKISWNENGTGKIAKLHSPDGQTFRSRIELMAYFKKAGRSKVDIDFYFPPLILRDEVASSESGIEMASNNSLKDKLIPADEIKGDVGASEGSEMSESDKPTDDQNASTDENERTPNKKLKTRSGPSIIKISKKTGSTPEGDDDTNMVLSEDVQKQLSELGNRAGKVLVVKSLKKRGRPPKIAASPSTPSVDTAGPRVKHVCRSQQQVLGIPRAIFPSPTKGGSPSGYVTLDVPSGTGKKRKKVVITTTACGKVLRKTQWCGKCVGCTTPNCLKCGNCLDMKKYGGPGTKKKPCSQRKCRNPRLSMQSAIKAETGSSKSADVSMERVEDMVSESLVASMQDTLSNVQLKKNQQQQQEQPVVAIRRRHHHQQQQNNYQAEVSIQRKPGKLHRQMAVMKHQDKSVFVPHQPTRPHPDDQKDLRKDIASGKEFVPGALINIDYWQEYDADDMMIKGFPIISSTPLSLEVLCFRCGSAGKDQLLFCVWCCEGIHPYCLEDGEEPETEAEELWWCCRRCATCHVCGFPGLDDDLLRCSDCRYYYHMECLGPAAHSNCQPQSDRPWKCVGCMRCDSCGSSGVAQWVAGATLPSPLKPALADMDLNTDIALCKKCITLREQGNFCPLCNGCYEDDDYDSKMMECGKCGEWIHALCEGLNNEHYQILSFLPDSVEYVCRGCHCTSKASWLEAVTTELLAGCQSVMQSMMSMRAAKHLIKRPDTAKATQCQTNNSLDQYKKESLMNFQVENKDKNYLVDSLITNKGIQEQNIQEVHSIYQSNLIENIRNKEELKNTCTKEKTNLLNSIENKESSQSFIDICDDQSDRYDKTEKSSIERHYQVNSLNEVSNVAGVITAHEQKRNELDKFDLIHSHLSEMQEVIHVSNIQSTVEKKTNPFCSVENKNDCEETIQNINKKSEKVPENMEVNELRGDNPDQRLEKEKNLLSFTCTDKSSVPESTITKSKDQEIDKDSIKAHENKDFSLNVSSSISEKVKQTEQPVKESLISHVMQKSDEISANVEGTDFIVQQDTATKLENKSVSYLQSMETSKCVKTSLASKCNEDRNKEKRKSSKVYPLRKTRSSVSIRRSLPTGFKLRECSVRLNDIYKVSQKNSSTEIENENNGEDETHVKSNESITQVEKHVEESIKSSCSIISQNTLNSDILSVTAEGENNLESNNEDRTKVLKNRYDVCKELEKRSFRSLDMSCELIKPVKSPLEFRSDVSCTQVDFRSDVSCTQVDGPNDEASSHMEDYFRNSSIQESSSVMLDDLQNTSNPTDRETISPTDRETDGETVSPTDGETDGETITPTVREAISPTDRETISPADIETISPSDREMIRPPDRETISSTDKEAISSTDREEINSTDREAITLTDSETISPSDIETISPSDRETISPANKISKDIDDDCVSSEASSFCDTDTEIESIQDDPDEPKDMFTIQEKICDRKYNSVLQFHVDMTRIIENGKNFNPLQSNNVQATYTKNMKEYFPWFDVQNANIFELVDKNRPFPIPHGDHDYAFQVGNCIKPFKLHDVSLSIKRKLSPYKQSLFCSKDNRRCILCGREGDTDPNYCGRLLYLGQNEWLHVNCGLWSSEVYEEADGGMQNVYLAASRGRMIKCNFCQERGATVGCCHKSCSVTYHFPCAKKAHSQFMEDKRIFCPTHYSAENGKSKKDDFKVSRCVYVDMDSEKRKWKQFLGNKVNIVIGSLSISNLGRIGSESDNNEALIPLGFMCTRLYWSTVDPTQRVRYTCTTKLIVPDPDGMLIPNAFHLTVDHSLSPHLVSKQIAIVNKWFKQLEHHNVEETSKKTNIIPAHLCPFYRSILDQEAASRREEILSDRESSPIVVESAVRQCIDEMVDKVSRSVEEESLLLDTEIPAIVSADDNELISMVLNDLDACDPTLTLQSTPSTSGRPSPLDIDFLNTCDQMLDNAKSPENGSKGSSSDDGSKEIVTNFRIASQSTISSASLPAQCPIEGENVQILQKLPTSDISTSFNMSLSCPQQPLSCPSQPMSCPQQPLACPSQPMSCPQQPLPCPPQPLSYPSQPMSCPPQPMSCPPQPMSCPPQPMSCTPQPMSCPQQPMSCPSQPMSCPSQPLSCPSQPLPFPSEVYPEIGLQMVAASKNLQQQLTVHHLPSQLPSLSQIVQPTASSTMQINPVRETTELVKNVAVEKKIIPEFSITDPQKNTTPLSTFIPTPVHVNTSSSSTFSGLSTFIPPTLNSCNENAFSTCFTNATLPTNLSSTPSFICGSFNNEARSNNTTIINSASSNSPSSNSSNSPSSSNSSSSNSCSGSSSSGESSSPERNDVPDKLCKKQILDTSVGTENVESESKVKEISGESTNAGDGSTSDSKCTGSGSVSGSSDCSSSGSESSLSTVRVSGKQNQLSTKLVVGKGSSNASSHKQICRVLPMPASASRRSSSASDHSDQGQANISPPTRTSSSTASSSSTSGSSSNESPNQPGGGQESGSHGLVRQQHPDNGQQSPVEHQASSGLHSSSDAAVESPGYRSPSSPSDINQPSPISDRDSSHHSPASPQARPQRTSPGITEVTSPITQDKKCKKICMKRNYKTVIKKYPLRSGMKKNQPYETVQIEINETYEIPGGRGTGFVRKSLKRKWSGIMDSEEEVMEDKSEDSKIKKEDDAASNIQCNLEEDSTSKISKKVLKFTDDDNDITVSIVNNNNLCEFGKTSRVRKYRTRTVLQLDGAADGSSSSAEMSQDEGVTDESSDSSQDETTATQQPSSSQPKKHQSTANKERPSDFCSLAQRIKQQSLARSAPGEEGPYKCTKCKRLYRTKESYQKHVETCTFEIDSSSTSDEDEESDDMVMDNQKSQPHTQVHETKGNRGEDQVTGEHEQRELAKRLGLGNQVEKELIQQSNSDVNDEKANLTSHIGSLEHLSNIVESVQEIDSSGDEPLIKKQRLNPSFPRQSGVHRQLRTGIFKRSGNISSLDETDEETYPSPPSLDALNSDVFIPPPVSPVKFNPTVKKSMSPRRYTNVRLMRGAHGYQYRRLTTQALSKTHEQFTPSQIYVNSTPQDSSQPLPSNFGQSMESENIAYQSGESSQYCGSNTQVPHVPQIVTVMSAPSVAVPPGYTLQYVGSYRDGSTVTTSNSGGNSGVMNVSNPGVAPSPNVNSGVLSYGSTPVMVQPPQLVDNDVVNHSSSGGIINYPSGPVVMPQPQIIMASQQGSLMLPHVVNTNITYTFASPETMLLNQSTVVAPGMQHVQYVTHSQQQNSLLQSNPEVVQYNPGAATHTQPHVHPTMVHHMSTGHLQPSVTHHPSIIPHHMPNVSMQTTSTVASHHSNMIASQIPNDQMQHSDGMTSSHMSRTVTQHLSSGQIPTSYVTISDVPNNQSCLPQHPHVTHQNIQHRNSIMYPGMIQGGENDSFTNFPVVCDSVNVSSTDFFSNPNRSRPQASVAPQIIQPQDSNLVTEKPSYESNPVRLPFSERPGGSVTRNVATVAPVTTVNITTSTSVASSRMETSTTNTENSVPRVATVRPRPTYSYRAAMKDKNVNRDKIELTRIKPLEHVPLSKSPKNVKSDSETDSDGEKNSPHTENDSKESEEKTQSYKLVMRKDSRTRTGFNVLPISGPSIPITSPEVKELRIKAKVSVGPKRKKAKNLEKDDILFIDKEKNCDILLNEEFPNVSENAQQQQANLPRQDGTSLFDASGSHSTEPYIVFELTSDDGFHVESRHISEVWQKVFDAVGAARANMRANDKVTRGFQPSVGSPISGLHMLGLTHNAVQYLLEQLPGAKDCHKYSFQFHRRPQEEGEVEENLTGCARTESFKCRSPYDIFSWLASKHRRIPVPSVSHQEEIQLSTRRATSLELPMAMRYRHLRETAREAVGVFRSEIHGRGLFCKRDIDSGEMVIEYAGQVIRSSLCDNREKYYESKGIGCYMFRIDDDTVIDATLNGNAARFINHSCDPNCYSRVVDILGKKHIIIFALRRILQSEELTYDYKFPIEDDKIPCTCGNRRCRKYLN